MSSPHPPGSHSSAAWWIRTDMRVLDNPALAAAFGAGPVVAVFVAAPQQWLAHGDAVVKMDFWLRNLHTLRHDLEALGVPLAVLRIGTWTDAPQALGDFCERFGVASLHANTEWAVNERRRDETVAAHLRRQGVDCHWYAGATLLMPGTVLNGAGQCYRVFTPFARTCRERLATAPLRPPSPLPAQARALRPRQRAGATADTLPTLEEVLRTSGLPRAEWPDAEALEKVRAAWPAGETAAHGRLTAFLDGAASAYDEGRDRPAVDGTSRLSPYLAAGVISPAACLRGALAANQGELDSGQAGLRTWITELLWREFCQHLLAAHPGLSMHQPMRAETASVPWRAAPDDLRAWCEGRTGFPLVDAAMRQLRAMGWMHNRLRMVTAMLLCKNLLIDWREGERWFMRQLIDGDIASNNGGWQWCASTGADAVPYFRVFNPLSQSRKVDPDGAFLRQWLPELAPLDNRSIHEPSAAQRAALGYPAAIVALGPSRLRAIEAFASTARRAPGPGPGR